MATQTGNSGVIHQVILWVKPRARILAPLFTLVILAIFFGIVTDHFLTLRNLENILEQASLLAVLATGVTMVLLLGEIDLSFANVATLVGMSMALMMDKEIATGWIILACILISAAVGLVNGTATAYIRVPSFMATLAMYQIAYGIAHYASHATPVFSVPRIFSTLGNKNLGFIPWIFICAVIVMGGAHFILRYTRFGRYIYMTGGNREAARVSGVNTRLVVTSVFCIAGFTAGFGGMLGIGRLGVAYDNTMNSKLIDGIAAVVLGGTSLTGGEGSILHTVIGVLIWTSLGIGLDLMDISIYVKDLVRGVILLLALIFNIIVQRSTQTEG
ncbi:ABC transporter permease [candidate division KSB3 bacterium]|uniref:ABC transporter permease n=1 Tax=candidate division KSB3 bacterium TaxID=2044937 RepID=A0A9D5JV07_9BACT|nr:ABC transporter permease [candidate division KSB3 bacterium]MBD3324427.1 ABC transporter permease [candidate division KSB3 bacterium]